MDTSGVDEGLLCILNRGIGRGTGCVHKAGLGAEHGCNAAPSNRSRDFGAGEQGRASFRRAHRNLPVGEVSDAREVPLKLSWCLLFGRLVVCHLGSS